MTSEPRPPPPGSQTGWRAAAGAMSAAVVVALALDVGDLGLRHVGPALALVPMVLFAVGGQALLGRVLPMFRR